MSPEVISCLKVNLSSFDSATRYASLTFMRHRFTEHLEFIDACIKAEEADASPLHFRDKQQHLTRVGSLIASSTSEVMASLGISFLLGSLFVNFTLLWQPIQDLLLRCLDSPNFPFMFRNEMVSKLKVMIDLFQNPGEADDEEKKEECERPARRKVSNKDRPDHVTFTVNLLQVFERRAQVFESVNREIVPLFLQLLRDEHAMDEEADDTPEEGEKIEKHPKRSRGNAAFDNQDRWRVIRALLSLFARFQNPKSLFKASEVERKYYDLLMDPRPVIQEGVFRCILTYDHSFIKPYQDHLLNLLKEDTFKSALADFNINAVNEEDRVLKDKDRDQLMPILLKILYGRMKCKTAHKRLKSASQVKRPLIMRFLAGCSVSEVTYFIDLIFQSIKCFLQLDYAAMVTQMASIQKVRSLSAAKMQIHFKNLTAIFEHFSNVTPLVTQFFKILLVICLWVKTMLQAPDHKKRILTEIRALRKNCLNLLTTFFTDQDKYELRKEEIDIIFVTMVEPNLAAFQIDGIFSPSPLLHLFLSWSNDSRYFPLFDYSATGVEKPISAIATVVANPKTSPQVANEILNIFANLFALDEYESMQTGEEDEAGDAAPQLPITCKQDGRAILEPHVRIVMAYYANKLKSCNKMKNKKRNQKPLLAHRDLQILSGLTAIAAEREDMMTLTKLLMDVFRYQYIPDSEVSQQHIAAIRKLAENCGPERIGLLSHLSPVFQFVTEASLRYEIAQVLQVLTGEAAEAGKLTQAVMLLNTCSRSSINEPDYDCLFSGFKMLTDALPDIQSGDQVGDLLKVGAYTCCFYIVHGSDQSVRSCSVCLLDKLIERLSKLDNTTLFFDICIRIILTQGVMRAIKNENEVTRREFLEVLMSLIRHGKEKHAVLREFSLLQHENADKDFWRNISHIQSHRRARSLTRLAADPLLCRLSQEVLWNYLIPLCEPYIVSPGKKPEPFLVSASIDFLAAASKHLKYKFYEILLKRYLSFLAKEPNHLNNVVQAISKILSNFNYDLSNAAAKVEEKSADERSTKDANGNESKEDVMIGDADEHATLTSGTRSGTVSQAAGAEGEKGDQTETGASEAGCETGGRKKQLSPGEAALIFSSITSHLLPRLRKCIFDVSSTDYDQDRIRKHLGDSDEVQRIPIAIALVKLLILMPPECNLLHENLTGILLRMCHFLKSKMESIRTVARKSLKTIAQDLGFAFLPQILRELKNGLTKGFQRHVLSFTIHYLLVNMGSKISAGSLDPIFPMLMSVCVEDLFGDVAQEKEAEELRAKLGEERKSKSYDIMMLMGRVSGEKAIVPVMQRLRDVLAGARTFRHVRRVSRCLDSLVAGLADNEQLSVKTLCTLIYGISKELIPQLQAPVTGNTENKHRLRSDCLLIKDVRPHKRQASRSSSSSHMHVILEKGFSLLAILLKKKRFSDKSAEDLSLLDPFVSILSDSLLSKHVKLVCNVMRCLLPLLKQFMCLPSFQKESDGIKNRLFVMMSENGTYTSQDPEIRQLSSLCFKCIGQLVSHIPTAELSDDQLIVLLSYIDQDLTEGGCKPVSFVLLTAIMQRGLHAKQLDLMMQKIAQLAIQSELDDVRGRCCKSWTCYLLNYDHGKHLKSHLLFFLRQLEYERETGRRAAIHILSTFVKSLSIRVVQPLVDLILLPLACRLINEESASCKEQIFQLTKELIARVDQSSRDRIWSDMVFAWLRNKSCKQQMLALHLLSIFLEVEKGFREKRVPIVLPVLVKSLMGSSASSSSPSEEEDEGDREEMDRMIFQRLSVLREILVASQSELVRSSGKDNANNKKEKKEKSKESVRRAMDDLWPRLANVYLSFPHSWVRLITAQVFGHLFSLYSPSELAQFCSHDAASSDEYLLREAEKSLPLLLHTFVLLFQNPHDLQPLAEQLLHNLAFVGRVMICLDRQTESRAVPNDLSLAHFVRRITDLFLFERRSDRSSTLIRTHVLKLVALVVVDMDQRQLGNVLPLLLVPLGREVTDSGNRETSGESLLLLSQQVLDVIKSLVGDQRFTEAYAQALQALRNKRLQKKRDRTLDVSTTASPASPTSAAHRQTSYSCSCNIFLLLSPHSSYSGLRKGFA